MKTTTIILQAVAGISFLGLLVLGILLWTGRASQLLPVHIVLGIVLVLALWLQAALAARVGAPVGLVAFAFAWGAIMGAFGMTQANILPGPYHWVIRVLHLLVGMVAMRLVGLLGVQMRRGAPGGVPVEANA